MSAAARLPSLRRSSNRSRSSGFLLGPSLSDPLTILSMSCSATRAFSTSPGRRRPRGLDRIRPRRSGNATWKVRCFFDVFFVVSRVIVHARAVIPLLAMQIFSCYATDSTLGILAYFLGISLSRKTRAYNGWSMHNAYSTHLYRALPSCMSLRSNRSSGFGSPLVTYLGPAPALPHPHPAIFATSFVIKRGSN